MDDVLRRLGGRLLSRRAKRSVDTRKRKIDFRDQSADAVLRELAGVSDTSEFQRIASMLIYKKASRPMDLGDQLSCCTCIRMRTSQTSIDASPRSPLAIRRWRA